jgi:tetratricopeptide (TPR) repeat protein
MDLLHFEAQDLYFDGPAEPEVEQFLHQASAGYADGQAEKPLLQALQQAPDSLTVLVALYRFYYYQHRLPDALDIAQQALAITSRRLGIPAEWRELDESDIGTAALQSMTLLRFHLLALKAAAYLLLRMGREDEGKNLLRKLVEIDSHNRLGTRQLLNVVESRLRIVA